MTGSDEAFCDEECCGIGSFTSVAGQRLGPSLDGHHQAVQLDGHGEQTARSDGLMGALAPDRAAWAAVASAAETIAKPLPLAYGIRKKSAE